MQPVDLQFEAGITAAAAGVVPGVGGAPFLPASAGQMQNAQVTGAQLIGRSTVSYEAIARSTNDKAAFESATKAVVRRLSKAVIKRLEIQLLHGRQGIGTIAANPANGATRSFVISDDSWAAGIWAGFIGSTIDLYNAAGVKQNAGSTSGGDPITITGVNTTTKTITATFGAAADQTLNLASLNVFFETASPTSEMAGIDYVSNTSPSSSTLFNISPASYDLWQSNQVSAVGPASFGAVMNALSLTAYYDMEGDAVAILSPKAYEAINTDQAALRMYDASYSEAKNRNGSRALVFNGQTGSIELMSHAFQKDGLFHIFVPDEAARVGASDVGFITRQGSEDKLILESATAAGSEMRCYSNQAFFTPNLRHMVRASGVTY